MLIADYEEKSANLKTVLDIQRIPRLGKGVDSNRNIKPESLGKAVEILNEYSKISIEKGSEQIFATATSFVRDSNNKGEFLHQIKELTNIKIEILSGQDEAKLTYIGAVYDILKNNNKSNIFTIDIGGGSTEIAFAKNVTDRIHDLKISGDSFNIGSVRIKERFLHNSPPLKTEINDSINFINDNLNILDIDISAGSSLIGIAGTITTLGACKLKLKSFERNKVEGLKLTTNDINNLLHYFYNTTENVLKSSANYMEGRADIIIPGTLILKCFMEMYNIDTLTISTKGLRYGVLLREIMKQN